MIAPQMPVCKTDDCFNHGIIAKRVVKEVLAIHVCCANPQLPVLSTPIWVTLNQCSCPCFMGKMWMQHFLVWQHWFQCSVVHSFFELVMEKFGRGCGGCSTLKPLCWPEGVFATLLFDPAIVPPLCLLLNSWEQNCVSVLQMGCLLHLSERKLLVLQDGHLFDRTFNMHERSRLSGTGNVHVQQKHSTTKFICNGNCKMQSLKFDGAAIGVGQDFWISLHWMCMQS